MCSNIFRHDICTENVLHSWNNDKRWQAYDAFAQITNKTPESVWQQLVRKLGIAKTIVGFQVALYRELHTAEQHIFNAYVQSRTQARGWDHEIK